MNCGYCKLTQRRLNEFTLEDWKNAFKIMHYRGIKTVKIMGGEPTVKSWLPDLIKYINKETDIKTALLSNSSFNEEYAKKLVDAGLYGYFASIDCLRHIRHEKDPVKKSNRGYYILDIFKNLDLPLRGANVVINKFNIDDVPQIAADLSNDGVYVNLCTVQTTSQNEKEFSKVRNNSKYVFSKNDRFKLTNLSDSLLEMKEKDYKLTVPYEYIRDIPLYGIHSNWNCDDLYQLRVDADGGLMLCNEYRTNLADDYNVLQMTKEEYEEFKKMWHTTRKRVNCDGCYWSAIVQAKVNRENQQLEFQYAS
jgi:cyclic pyranopterin phosphate synthase